MVCRRLKSPTQPDRRISFTLFLTRDCQNCHKAIPLILYQAISSLFNPFPPFHPFPAIPASLEIYNHFQPFTAIYSHLYPFQPIPGIQSHFQPVRPFPCISSPFYLFPSIPAILDNLGTLQHPKIPPKYPKVPNRTVK